jgi:hypothetical protein
LFLHLLLFRLKYLHFFLQKVKLSNIRPNLYE